MNTLKTLLVAVDFSTGSRAALEQASRIARLNGAKLHVLHVVDSAAVAVLADSRECPYENQARTAEEGANSALKRWLAQSEMPEGYEITIAIGTPLHEILEHLRSLHADLLVAGITGVGEVPAGAGSMASKLARKAPCRVLLVRAAHHFAWRKVVACVDYSDTAREVASAAQRVALKDGASVDFLHIWQEPWIAAPFSGPMGETAFPGLVFTPEERTAFVQNLTQELQSFVEEASQGITCAKVLREASSYSGGIAAHAEATKADLIVIGSKGRTNLHYVLLGSTAERLLTQLPCSLLVIKPPQE